MIKFLMTHPVTKRKILGLIITEDNVVLLKKGKPIHMNSEDLKLPYFKYNEFILMYYPTLEEADKDLREKGYINKDTIIEELKPTTRQ